MISHLAPITSSLGDGLLSWAVQCHPLLRQGKVAGGARSHRATAPSSGNRLVVWGWQQQAVNWSLSPHAATVIVPRHQPPLQRRRQVTKWSSGSFGRGT
jgi:hypothetical protein